MTEPLRVHHFTGTPSAMGEAFGEACRSEIAELYALRVANALAQAREFGGRIASEAELLAIARESFEPSRSHHPEGFEELCGIAAGSNLDPAQVMALGGLTDLRDVLAWGGPLEATGGCTCFALQRDRSAIESVLCGQSWDLMTDNQPFVVGVHRKPADGPETWSVTTVGCLSLIGMNEDGLAVCTTNLRTRDARPGVPYLNLIHRALACRDLDEAVRGIETARRAAAHSYTLATGDRAVVLECTGTLHRRLEFESGFFVQTNHCLVPAHAAIEGDTPRASSEARHARMTELLESCDRHDVSCLVRHLADEQGGELAICREDFAGISSNAAVVMDPAARKLHACHGPPSRGRWVVLGG